ncbi:hypothetical protein RCL_jg7857.t1 [Rhizophagus clarus]|uniref:Uncharacterized protein n=1 Tax=Rhizophagus clarus TaxID=94130 RepID=A0A8H3MFM4_9GLOM|nr:hypothetical protein RCL_jg7857.t1 [Rhizophagus clarus]
MGSNAVALAKRVKGATDTSTPSTNISGGYDTSPSSNFSTNHNDGIVEGLANQGQDPNTLVPHHTNTTSLISPSLNRELDSFLQRERIEFIDNNLDCMDHSVNFINLKMGFHNINGLSAHPKNWWPYYNGVMTIVLILWGSLKPMPTSPIYNTT